MEYDNTNRGVLFANYQRQDEADPDYSGKINIEGQEQPLYAKVQSDTKVELYSADGLWKGSISKTDKEGKSEKYPDWKGGTGTHWIAGWKKTSKKGANFLSLSIEKKQDAVDAPAPAANQSDEPLPF